MRTSRHLVVGLPESGKTTFAAALWYLLDSGEVETKLVKGRHDGEFRYLEEIAKLWGDGWRAGRTHSNRQERVIINLHDRESGADAQLEFTDLSGESFERLFATRRCNQSFVDLVNSCDGVLLFVSARRKVDDHTILDFMDIAPDDETTAPKEEAAPKTKSNPKFDPAKVPQQVQLVDLLQTLVLPPFVRKKLRIAVIISAWDLALKDSPQEWLKGAMPLLDQFLTANPDSLEFEVFGVSAQGGELPKKEDGPGSMREQRERILSLPQASKRIMMVGGESGPHDLTAPLFWLGQVSENNVGT